jgi:hypothetical protein
MNKLSDEELIEKVVEEIRIIYPASKKSRNELLTRLAKGRKAILAMEKIRQHIPLGDRLVPLTSIYDIVDLFNNYDKE